jgi:hypothetical protein
MAGINDMINARMPDEVELFADSIPVFVEEAMAEMHWSNRMENDLEILEKSIIADMVALALIMPSMSHYKKSIKKAKGEGAGEAEFLDNKLEWLQQIQSKLENSIAYKKTVLLVSVGVGAPMVLIESV